MDRAGGDQVGAAEFHDLSLVHDGNPGREIADYRHGVRDEEIGKSEVALKLREKIYDLRADADVEGGDGLVAYDKFGTEGKGTGDADALPLSTGELVRVASAGRFIETDCTEEFGNTHVESHPTN